MFPKLRLRPAESTDFMLIFNWANDSLTRKMSFNQEPISLEAHEGWFKQVLSRQILLLVAEAHKSGNWHPIGTFRVGEDGEVSMSLAAEYRGQHLATPVISIGIKNLGPKFHKDKLVAHIKKDNIASIKAFERAGFYFVAEAEVRGNPCLEYIYELSGASDSG